MLRSFLFSSRRLLCPRRLPTLTLTPQDPPSDPMTTYDIQRKKHARDYHLSRFPLAHGMQPHLFLRSDSLFCQNVRWASKGKVEFKFPDPKQIACNMINMLKCVDLNDLKDANPSAFYPGIAVGAVQVVIPFLELMGGYSPVLTLFQLHSAAVMVGFFSGIKWGLALSNNPVPTPTWDTMKLCLLPAGLAVTGLLLPYPLGFLTVASALVTTLYLDLASCAYPPWATALTLYVVLTTLIGLLLALMAYVLFHNREKNKKPVKDEEEDLEEDDVEGANRRK